MTRVSWTVGIAVVCAALPAMAQQGSVSLGPHSLAVIELQPTSSVQQTPNAGDQTKEDQGNKSDPHPGTSDNRLFGALPDFLTVENADNVAPLTTKQKFDVTIRSTFDLGSYVFFGGLAGISQAENADPSYGQGAKGYAKRYGLALADGTLENFMTTAILPSMLRQDPRYYRLGDGGLWHRTGYSVSRIFVTRSDAGHVQFNFSEILGSALAAGLYNTYHPASDRTFTNTLASWWMQVGYDTAFIIVREFWPDVQHRFRKPSKEGG
jgi:hypothetical protein